MAVFITKTPFLRKTLSFFLVKPLKFVILCYNNYIISGFGGRKMKVTNVRIKLVNTEGRLKAVGSITISDSFVVHDVRVLEGEKGMFVAMPSKKMPNGMFRDIAHPINTETRTMIDAEVLKAYEEALQEAEVETVEEV